MTSSFLGVVLAGISYDPEIRGVLVVVVSGAILCGSVYLLLATNIGARLGFQVALTGLLGWLMLLSAFWWIYGVGAIGDLPEWRVEEINIGDLSQAQLEEARSLADGLPTPEEIFAEHPELTEEFEEFDEDDLPTLSEIAALPDLPEDVQEDLEGLPDDWVVLPQTEIGDAQAAADAALIDEDTGLYTSNTEYVLIGGFDRGGEPDRESDSLVDRALNKLANSVRVLNPPHHVIIQVQTSESTVVPEGNAPLTPVADEDEPVVSVIMVRDLGTRRGPPFFLAVIFGLLFLLMCARLHDRDRRARELSTAPPGS